MFTNTAIHVTFVNLFQWWSEDGVESSGSQQPSVSDQQPAANSKSIQTEQSVALEAEISEQKEVNRQLMTRERDTQQRIQQLQQELDKRLSEAVANVARLREVESQLAEVQLSHQVECSDSQKPSSDQQPASSKSIQTEQSVALEVEIDEQKELNRQLMTNEKDMKQYIQLLQRELDKRFNEAVVNAARLREIESKLAEVHPSQPSTTPQQVADEPPYKRRHFHFHNQQFSLSLQNFSGCHVA